MKELGIFTDPSGSFKTDKEIKRQAALDLGSLLIYETPVAVPFSMNQYIDKAETRSNQIKESSQRHDGKVKAYIPNTSIISVIGDIHLGHPNVDHDRLRREIQVIKNTPDSFVILAGDLVDGIFWGGESQAEQSQNLSEQQGFLRALFRELKGKIIVGISGEHDSKWSARSGDDSYSQFSEISDAPYVRGVAEITLDVGNQEYQIVAQHQAKGHSMYNKSHPTFRQARFHLQGADVYISAHTHQKQISQESIRDTKGSHPVTHINIGPYKTGDGYGERRGYVSQNESDMFGASFRVHADRKKIDTEPSILEAHRMWIKSE